MIFVERKDGASITGVFANRQHAEQEELPDDHPEVVAFRAPSPRRVDPIAAIRQDLLDDPTLWSRLKALI